MEDKKSTLYYIFVGAIVLFILAVAWYLCAEPDVHDYRGTATDIRDELGNTGNAQRNAQEHLDNAGRRIDRGIDCVDGVAGRIGEAESRIESVQERSESVAGILEDSERRIAESKRIIQSVRERTR